MKPFKEHFKGALGRYQQAKLNGIDMRAMVRFLSAVRIDWNDLDNYVQIELLDDACTFSGTYKPQPKWSEPKYNFKDIRERKAKEQEVAGGSVMFDVLGGLKASHLYIPNLKDKDVKRSSVISAHDMTALGMALDPV